MKRTAKLFVSLILLISIVFSSASCQYVDELIGIVKKGEEVKNDKNGEGRCDCCIRTEDGYTGGITDRQHEHDKYEMYWLETYDEVLEAIELLKSHGSTITPSLAFNCEGELMDVKYCFLFEKKNAEPLEEGKNFFDRKIDGGKFGWYGFFEEISIEDLVYLYVDLLDTVSFSGSGFYYEDDFSVVEKIDDVSGISFYSGKENTEELVGLRYKLYYRGEYFARLYFQNTVIDPANYREFLNTFVVIE